MKKIIGALIAAVIICSIGVYASGLGNTIVSNLTADEPEVVDEYNQRLHAEDEERSDAIDEALVNAGVNILGEDKINADTTISSDEDNSGSFSTTEDGIDKYNQLIVALNATITDPGDFNDFLLRYEYLKEVYHITPEQQEYIANLVIDGCDAKDIIDLAFFWIGTNDDISIIKSMYNLKPEYEGKKSWYENAYDRVTNAKNGSLTTEEVEEYMKKGLTAGDILAADELCRKGVYTINQILDKMCEGSTFVSIANEVENGELIGIMPISEDGSAAVDYSAIENPHAVIDSEEMSLITGQPRSEIIASAAVGEDVENTLHEKRNEKYSEIMLRLDAVGLIKEEPEVE